MSKKKPIAAFEEYLDKKAVTTVEENNAKELEEIINNLHAQDISLINTLLEILLIKGVVTKEDFKRIFEKD